MRTCGTAVWIFHTPWIWTF